MTSIWKHVYSHMNVASRDKDCLPEPGNKNHKSSISVRTSWITVGATNWTQTSFSQTFRALPGYSNQNPRISRQEVWFSCVSRDMPNFLALPIHLEDPNPTGRYPDPKVWVCAPFSCRYCWARNDDLILSKRVVSCILCCKHFELESIL